MWWRRGLRVQREEEKKEEQMNIHSLKLGFILYEAPLWLASLITLQKYEQYGRKIPLPIQRSRIDLQIIGQKSVIANSCKKSLPVMVFPRDHRASLTAGLDPSYLNSNL